MAEGLVTPRTFKFLRELAKNNRREWFNANKQRYIDEVRDPLLILVAQLGSPLAKISRLIVAAASTAYTEAQVCAADFPTRFIKACEQKVPLMEFLTTAVGLRW